MLVSEHTVVQSTPGVGLHGWTSQHTRYLNETWKHIGKNKIDVMFIIIIIIIMITKVSYIFSYGKLIFHECHTIFHTVPRIKKNILCQKRIWHECHSSIRFSE